MKPRLLIIHNRFVIGGPALDTIPLAHFLSNDFEIHILFGSKEKDETEPWFLLKKYTGLQLVHIDSFQRSPHPIKDFKAYRFIRRYIAQFNPHIIHTHGAKSGLLGRLASRRQHNAAVVHTFHGHLFHSYFNRLVSRSLVFLERSLLKYTDKVIAISKTQQRDLQSFLSIPASKIQLIPLGIDYIDCSAREHYRKAFKRSYQLEEDVICIGILGRLVPIKNLLFFLQVAEYIYRNYNDKKLRFFVIGDGSEKPKMINYLRERQVPFTEKNETEFIVFTSWVQNVQQVLEGLDIVTLTSLNEGTPMSLIEAQMCGVPVVAVNVGGVSDTMVAGETGILLEGHNVELFAAAIIRLAEDGDLRKRMGAKAKEFASLSFSKEKEIDSFRELYRSLLTN